MPAREVALPAFFAAPRLTVHCGGGSAQGRWSRGAEIQSLPRTPAFPVRLANKTRAQGDSALGHFFFYRWDRETMNKTELIDSIAGKSGVTKVVAAQVLDA